MPVTVAFRGVSAFVRDAKTGAIDHLLLPNAESVAPPDAETGDDGLPRHADNTRATPHYAGMLLPSSSGDEYVKLLNRVVVFPGSALPKLDGSLMALASLGDMTSGEAAKTKPYPLKPLPRNEWHKLDGHVGTDIELHNGTLSAGPPSKIAFNVDGHHRKDKVPIPPTNYTTVVIWTADDETPVALEIYRIIDAQGTLAHERTVTLSPSGLLSACIYNFDNGIPTLDELVKEQAEVNCKGRLCDHDFKWIYALMKRHSSFSTWQEWLGGEEFPAPWAPCSQLRQAPHPAGNKKIVLLPVSTCFQTVVDE
jgi:hypothetical protein